MSLQRKFYNFKDKIKLGREDEAYRDARVKDDSILTALKLAFKESGYPIIEDFMQGSLITDTAIKHPTDDFDIDRAIVIDAANAPDNPVEAKKVVFGVLEKRGFKNATIKKPCVTADYASLNLHIDIVVYRKNGDSYELAVGRATSSEANREWSWSEPKKLIEHINDKSQYLGSGDDKLRQYKRLVRYIKRWRDEKFGQSVGKKVFSIGLALIFKEQFAPSFDENGKAQDLQALRATVNGILNGNYFQQQFDGGYKVNVYLPTAPFLNVFDNSSIETGTQLFNKFTAMLKKLDNAFEETSLKKQCEIMQDLFGDDFEVPVNSGSANNSKKTFVNAGIVGTSQGA
jgi:hypothetical protein